MFEKKSGELLQKDGKKETVYVQFMISYRRPVLPADLFSFEKA